MRNNDLMCCEPSTSAVEAAWLILNAPHIISNKALISKWKNFAVEIVKVIVNGIDTDEGLWYEYDPEKITSQKKNTGGYRPRR